MLTFLIVIYSLNTIAVLMGIFGNRKHLYMVDWSKVAAYFIFTYPGVFILKGIGKAVR